MQNFRDFVKEKQRHENYANHSYHTKLIYT